MKKLFCILLIISTLFVAACTSIDDIEKLSSADISIDESIITESSEENSVVSSSPASNDGVSEESALSSDDLSSEDESSIGQPVSSVDPSEDNSSTVDNGWIYDLKGQQDTDYHGYTAEQLDDYFDDALFVGDSVSHGFKYYTTMYEKGIFSGMTFHTAASYGFHNSLWSVSSKSVHPVYQGQQRTIWEMVSLTNAKKVFIGFGLNDFGYATPGSLKNCIDTITANIKAVNPDIEIIFLSSGYFTKAGEKYNPAKNDYRTCERQREYNQFVLEYCNSLGYDYIDVSSCFADDYGYLDTAISSDNYCHANITHYHLWRDIFYGYAADKINGNYKNPARMK